MQIPVVISFLKNTFGMKVELFFNVFQKSYLRGLFKDCLSFSAIVDCQEWRSS